MISVRIREPLAQDKEHFIKAMQASTTLHSPWVNAPQTSAEFDQYLARSQQPNQKSYFVVDKDDHILGVFNINEIVRGYFQSAYLGFYGVAEFSAQGHMSAGLKLVLEKVFTELKLHRIEANIQPENVPSIQLVQNNRFNKEGYSPRYLNINGVWCDHERWAITLEEWSRRIT